MDAEKPSPVAYRFDRFILDLDRGALFTADGAELPLRPKSFALLQFLVENAGRLLDRDTLLSAVWPDVIVTEDSITQCVRDIRLAFGAEAHGLLRTVQRRGYVFAATVSRTDHAMPLIAASNQPRESVGSNRETELDEKQRRPEPTEPVRPSRPAGAERRHLTILCCDLAEINELSERLDPEELGSVVRIYRENCVAAITRCGGSIESDTGDGMLAFFGYPEAREDAAEQSVRAGLAIVEAIRGLRPGADLALHARVGIATGVVITEPARQDAQGQIAIGTPLNLAARLLAIAEPGTVMIADGTRRLVGSLFALVDMGRHPLKSSTGPMQAWRVTADGSAESRFKALRGTNITPLVGREQELTLLLDRWEQAREGEGQAVLLAGEPGIGKSRLVEALRDRLADVPHIYLGCYCSPHRRDSPLMPVIAQLERAANFSRDDAPEEKRAKLETMLAKTNEDITHLAPRIATLLSIAGDGRSPPRNVSPPVQREQTLAALVDQFAGLSAHRPVLLVCEDLHWADPTTLELLNLALDRLQSLRALALMTFRTGFLPPWPGYTHVTGLTLSRLSRRRCGQLVNGLTGNKPLPQRSSTRS